MKPDYYVYSPNNIYPEIRENGGKVIYAAGPGIPTLNYMFEIADMGNKIHVYCHKYGNTHELCLVLVFDTAKNFIEYCKIYGELSEPGMPAYSNSEI